ncbi:MAG: hypothetical protein DRI57_16825, partial [Deltaproteobacteria bacterium]
MAFFFILSGSQYVHAQPELSINICQLDSAGNPECNITVQPPIYNCEDVTFRVILTNIGTQDAVDVNISNTMPDGFSPTTSSQTGQTVPADGAKYSWDFTYATNCEAVSGDHATVVTFKDSLTGPTYPDIPKNRPFTVMPGAITITKVATHVGVSSIAETSEPNAKIGDVITWAIRVSSSGLGNVKNVEVTETLGSGLSFTDETEESPRLFDKNTYPALRDIASGDVVEITVKTKVSSCSGLTNSVSAKWGCASEDCLKPVTAQSGVNLQLENPLITFTPPAITVNVPYCSSSVIISDISFDIGHAALSSGDAGKVSLEVDFGGVFEVENITSPTGASYNSTTKSFENIGDIPLGDTATLTFSLKYTPDTDWCSSSPLSEGLLLWLPTYYDQCNIPYFPPLQSSNYTIQDDPASSRPTISVDKSCSIGGSEVGSIISVSDTDQTATCTITVDYSFPGACSQDTSFTLNDTYPGDWTPVAPFLSTTIPAGTFSGTGTQIYTQDYTIPASAESLWDTACGLTWETTTTISGTDCCSCNMSDLGTVSSSVECPIPPGGGGSSLGTIDIDATRTVPLTGTEICEDTNFMSFTSTYTFTGTAWDTAQWTNPDTGTANIIFTEQLSNRLQLEGNPTITVTGNICAPTPTTNSTAPTSAADGTMTIEFTNTGTGNCYIGTGAVLTIQYDLKPTEFSPPDCGSDTTFTDMTTLEVFNTSSLPKRSVLKDLDEITTQGSEMTVSVSGLPSVMGPCGDYSPTVTLSKASDTPAYDVVLFVSDDNYGIVQATGGSGVTPINGFAGEAATVEGKSGYLFNYGDLFSGASGQNSVLNFTVKKRCNIEPELFAKVYYNDRCGNGNLDTNFLTPADGSRDCSGSDSKTGIFRKPHLSVTKFPEVVYSKGITSQSGEPAVWTITVLNSGSGSAYNVEVIEELESDLNYLSSSWNNSTGITEYADNNYPDSDGPPNGTPFNGKAYVIAELTPGEKRVLTFRANITGCESATNTVTARVFCLANECNSDTKTAQVLSPETDLSVTTTFISPANSCDIKKVRMVAKNSGKAPIREIILKESIPNSLTYIEKSWEYRINSGAWTDPVPATVEPKITGGSDQNMYQWEYDNTELPDDLEDKLAILAPDEMIEIRFDAYVSCSFDQGQIRFNAEYDECGPEGRESTSDYIFNVIPNKPIVNITMSPADHNITCGSNVEWTVSVTNESLGTAGQAIPAQYIWMELMYGDAYIIDPSTGFVGVSTATPHLAVDSGTKTISWEMADLAAGETREYKLSGTFDGDPNCNGSFKNTITGEVRCLSPGATVVLDNPPIKDDGCVIPPGPTATAKATKISPTLVSEVGNLQACSDNSQIKIKLTNTSTVADLYNLYADIQLPDGVNFIPGTAKVLGHNGTTELSSTDPSVSGNVL